MKSKMETRVLKVLGLYVVHMLNHNVCLQDENVLGAGGRSTPQRGGDRECHRQGLAGKVSRKSRVLQGGGSSN